MSRLRATAKQPFTASRLVTCFALLAFFLQSFAIQTHVHQLGWPTQVAQTGEIQGPNVQLPGLKAPAPAPLKVLDPLDPGSCRLCQELVQAGAFFSPATLALSAGLAYVAVEFAVQAAEPGLPHKAFAWQSRAPPRP